MSTGLFQYTSFSAFSALRVVLVVMLPLFVFTESPAQTAEQIEQLQQMGIDQLPQTQVTEPLEFPTLVDPLPEVTEDTDFNLSSGLLPGDTVIIEFALRAVDLDEDEAMLDEDEATLERLTAGNPYKLDDNGFLLLPGVPAIQVAGLSVEEAMVRIRAEPQLVWLEPLVTFLPLQSFGVDSLQPFGYDLFRGVPTTFAPATDVPVPSDYIMGPGDTVNILLFGATNAQYGLEVSRDGTINFPEIGPIRIAGLNFEELRSVIGQTVEEQMIGVSASVTLGALRSIRIFVLGDVQQPGSYTVSGLSTMTNALFVSGGVNDIGSLRHIELRRGGETVSTLDLYDLLLRGDTSSDERLQPGDVIFAPIMGDSVSVYGAVMRPAIYELNGENNVEAVITLAGGLRSNADVNGVTLQSFVSDGSSLIEINLTSQTRESQVLQDGDILMVPSRVEQLNNAVRLSGNVFQPGLYPWHEGLTVTGLVGSQDAIKPGSDLGYVLIRREIEHNVHTEVFSIDLQSAWNNPEGTQDVFLQSRDTVYVFDRLTGRQGVIPNLIDELKAQTFYKEEAGVVNISGEVGSVGDYPLEPGMTIVDLLRAGGGLTESAYRVAAELVRSGMDEDGVWQNNVVMVNINDALAGLAGQNISLLPYDELTIRTIPNWSEDETIDIIGEIIFPGSYSLRPGETVTSLIERAGGLTEEAFLKGALFVREDLVEREALRLENLATRIEMDLQSLPASPETTQAITAGTALVARLRATNPVGRLIINLNSILAGSVDDGVILRANDQLYIPPIVQEVTVIGEIQTPVSHLFEAGFDRNYYIDSSGGVTDNADVNNIYIISSDGSARLSNGSLWSGRNRGREIEAGDTIVVPGDVSVALLPTILAGTQVLYNIAIATAAISSF